MTPWKQYLQTQLIANFSINLLINGAIAFFSFRRRETVPAPEMAVDAAITVFIISFLVAWIAIIVLRGEIEKNNIQAETWQPIGGLPKKLPGNALLGAFLIALVLTLVFGGGLLSIGFYLLWPNGVSGLSYVVIKSVFAGLSAAIAAAAAIFAVLNAAAHKAA